MPKMMKDDLGDTAERMQRNIGNLPITSMALAGLVGAGAMALLSRFLPR